MDLITANSKGLAKHELLNESGELLSKPDWEWAEWVDNAVLYAEHGRLYKTTIKNTKALSDPVLLHDFNGYEFEPKTAPY